MVSASAEPWPSALAFVLFGRPRSQACQRSFNTENVVVNKPSNASYHRLNTDEKRNFRAGRSNGDPGLARLPRLGRGDELLGPPQPHRQPCATGDAFACRHGADADGGYGD